MTRGRHTDRCRTLRCHCLRQGRGPLEKEMVSFVRILCFNVSLAIRVSTPTQCHLTEPHLHTSVPLDLGLPTDFSVSTTGPFLSPSWCLSVGPLPDSVPSVSPYPPTPPTPSTAPTAPIRHVPERLTSHRLSSRRTVPSEVPRTPKPSRPYPGL